MTKYLSKLPKRELHNLIQDFVGMDNNPKNYEIYPFPTFESLDICLEVNAVGKFIYSNKANSLVAYTLFSSPAVVCNQFYLSRPKLQYVRYLSWVIDRCRFEASIQKIKSWWSFESKLDVASIAEKVFIQSTKSI